MSACDRCLRRAALLGLLGPRLGRVEPRRGRHDTRLLLALPDDELIRAVGGPTARAIADAHDGFDASAMRDRVAAARLTSVCRHRDGYPAALAPLEDAPHALFVRGDVAALAEVDRTPSVALVGGRSASTYALETAHELARSLAVAGVPIVSGLALGVDAAAHRGALAGSGLAIAVLGSGADVVYPRRHRDLYARIEASGGAIVSELPPGTQAAPWAFPARNRVMAGLAAMTVVVEARERSGSLITSDFAEQIGREVGAVPGRVNVAHAAGSNRLIADGAAVILRAEDILDRIFHAGARPLPPPARVELDSAGHAVLDAIEAGESPLERRELGIKEVRAALGRLEGLGLVRRDGLGGYERTGLRCERA
jgi:DNA processing protein